MLASLGFLPLQLPAAAAAAPSSFSLLKPPASECRTRILARGAPRADISFYQQVLQQWTTVCVGPPGKNTELQQTGCRCCCATACCCCSSGGVGRWESCV